MSRLLHATVLLAALVVLGAAPVPALADASDATAPQEAPASVAVGGPAVDGPPLAAEADDGPFGWLRGLLDGLMRLLGALFDGGGEPAGQSAGRETTPAPPPKEDPADEHDDAPEPESDPEPAPAADVCTDADSGGHVNDLSAASDVTTEQADVDGDGQPDDVTAYRLNDEWWVRFATATGYTVERTFQVTGSMAPVRPYGHGRIGVERDAVFLVESTSASGENLLIMGLWEDDDGRPCVPAPIDAEHNLTFPVHASMGAPTGVACLDQTGEGRQELVVTQATQRQDGGYDWDSAIWRWNGEAYSTVQGSALEYLGTESGTADSLEQLSGEGRVGFQCESYG